MSVTTVEFLGLSGAGKSTVARHLVERLRREGGAVSTRTEMLGDLLPPRQRHLRRARLIAGEIVHRPSLYVAAMRLVLASGQSRARDYPKLIWNFWTVLAAISRHRRSGSGVLVMDQGLFQAVWSVSYMARKPLALPLWHRLIRRAGLDGLAVIVTEVPPDLARVRLEERARKLQRVGRAGKLDDLSAWVRLDGLMQAMIEGARTEVGAGAIHSVCTDGGVSAADLAENLISELRLKG